MDVVLTAFRDTMEFLLQFPVEILFTGALWFVLAVYAFSMGTSRLNAIALALTISGLLFVHIATAWPLGGGATESASPWASSVVVFGVLALIYYGVARRMTGETFEETGAIVSSVIGALAVVAIFLALWSNIPALASFQPFPAPLGPYFGAQFFFWWMFGSLVALAAMSQNRFW